MGSNTVVLRFGTSTKKSGRVIGLIKCSPFISLINRNLLALDWGYAFVLPGGKHSPDIGMCIDSNGIKRDPYMYYLNTVIKLIKYIINHKVL